MNKKVTVSILGCGWYGLPLAASLAAKGYHVKGSVTSPEKIALLKQQNIEPYLISITPNNIDYDPAFFDCDVLWLSVPPRSKAGEAGDYAKKIAQVIAAVKKHGVKHVVHISSTGVYGDHNLHVDELTPPEPISTSGKALLEVEELFRGQSEFTITIIRFGGLFGPGRDPGRFFAGKKNILNGKAPINLIHLDDCLGISHAILNKKAFGHTYNACAPYHPEKAQFYTAAAIASGLAQPEFIDELKEWKVVDSANIPGILNYTFDLSHYP